MATPGTHVVAEAQASGALIDREVARNPLGQQARNTLAKHLLEEKHAAGLGFCYNVGALGGAVGPVLGAAIAAKFSLGFALAILSFGFAAVVMISIGANIPRLLQKLVDPQYVRPEDGNDELIKEG